MLQCQYFTLCSLSFPREFTDDVHGRHTEASVGRLDQDGGGVGDDEHQKDRAKHHHETLEQGFSFTLKHVSHPPTTHPLHGVLLPLCHGGAAASHVGLPNATHLVQHK